MTVQTDRVPDDTFSNDRSVRQPHRIPWLLAVIVAMAIAAVAGVAIAAHVSRIPPNTGTIYQEPNANTREGRVLPAPYQEPNANIREGRVLPAPYQEPNANIREGRVLPAPYQEPNANTREDRVTGNS